MQLPNRKILILAVCLITLVAVSIFAWNLLNPDIPPKYEKNITRNVNNFEEENALTVAETVDYSKILSIERFVGLSNPQDYLHPDTYLAYTGANFIDSEVINYFETRYEDQRGKINPRQIELDYEANVSSYSDFRIYNSPAPEGVSWHNITIVMSSSDGSVWFNSGQMRFFYKNQSNYQMTEWEYDFNFSNCHVIEMQFRYSEIYAPTAGFYSTIHQIVVLDQEKEPVLVGLESGMAVS